MSPTTQLLLLAQLRDPLYHSDALHLALRQPGAAGNLYPQKINSFRVFPGALPAGHGRRGQRGLAGHHGAGGR